LDQGEESGLQQLEGRDELFERACAQLISLSAIGRFNLRSVSSLVNPKSPVVVIHIVVLLSFWRPFTYCDFSTQEGIESGQLRHKNTALNDVPKSD
jgi:hypothetical protein